MRVEAARPWHRKGRNPLISAHALLPDAIFNIDSCSRTFLSASLGVLIDDPAQGSNTTSLPTSLTAH
jgi:hypothetical protein